MSWFAAPWLSRPMNGLLTGDLDVLRLLRVNPLPAEPTAQVRVSRYHYLFTTRRQPRQTGMRWERVPAGMYREPGPRT